MALKNNTWKLNQWYAEKVAGNIIYIGAPQLNAWGKNTSGLLGQNDTTQRSSPVQVPGTTWQSLSHTSGSNDTNHVFATKTDGTLWTWGNCGNGQLGQNSEVHRSSPIQLPGEWDGKNMIASGGSSFGIKTDGTLWAWGRNTSGYGRLGLNNKTSYSSPAQIPGTTWSKINANGFATMATKTNGTLWTWGNGNVGQLGINNQTNYSSPKQVPGTTWSILDNQMSGGNNWQTAIKTDGTLWVWGDNNYGLLGQNQAPAQLAALSSPTQITGTTWANVHTNKQSIIAVKTDGSLWSWGYNGNGQLGIDNTTAYSSPTKIAGDWKQGVGEIGSTEFGFMAIKMV